MCRILTAQCGGQCLIPFPSRRPWYQRAWQRYARYDEAFKTPLASSLRRARSSVEESGTCGVGTKTQAGAGVSARKRALDSGMRARRKATAAGDERALGISPGRLKTAIGTIAAIRSQSRQR